MSRGHYVTVSVDAEAEVHVDDVIEKLTDDELLACVRARMPHSAATDRQPEHYVEAAFLAAKALPNCPRELVDLFWHVHGRAM